MPQILAHTDLWPVLVDVVITCIQIHLPPCCKLIAGFASLLSPSGCTIGVVNVTTEFLLTALTVTTEACMLWK